MLILGRRGVGERVHLCVSCLCLGFVSLVCDLFAGVCCVLCAVWKWAGTYPEYDTTRGAASKIETSSFDAGGRGAQAGPRKCLNLYLYLLLPLRRQIVCCVRDPKPCAWGLLDLQRSSGERRSTLTKAHRGTTTRLSLLALPPPRPH